MQAKASKEISGCKSLRAMSFQSTSEHLGNRIHEYRNLGLHEISQKGV